MTRVDHKYEPNPDNPVRCIHCGAKVEYSAHGLTPEAVEAVMGVIMAAREREPGVRCAPAVKSAPEPKPVILHIPVDKGLVDRIEDFRFAQRIKTRTTAVRRLLELGLEQGVPRG